jgi:SAM-dependent methyltransferase
MKKSTAQQLLKITNELYKNEAQSFSDTRHDIWEKEIIDFVNKIKPGSSILDLGCGNGRLLAHLRNVSGIMNNELGFNGFNYLGVDSNKKFVEMNSEKFGIDSVTVPQVSAIFKVGDGLKMNFDNEFDYVISIAVLHHIPSEELQLKFLKNIYNSLKPNLHPAGGGGKILISTWNRLNDKYQKLQTQNLKLKAQNHNLKIKTNNLSMQQFNNDLGTNDHIVPWRQSGNFRFIHTFEPEELKLLAQKVGFKNIQVIVSKHGIKTDTKTALNIYLTAEK